MGISMAHVENALAEALATAHASDVAVYISSITRELRDIAGKHDLEFLAYLLAMAADEASAIVSSAGPQTATDPE